MNPAFRELIPFRVKARTCVDLSIIDLQTDLRSSIGPATLAGALKYAAHQRYLRRRLSYNDQVKRIKNSQVAIASNRPFGAFDDRSGHAGRLVGTQLIKTLWLEDALRREECARAYMSQITGDVWKIDHTFYSTKHVRENSQTLSTAQFGIMNEIGQVVKHIPRPSSRSRSRQMVAG